MSGLSRTPGKRVWVNSPPRVRIPLPPPTVRPKKPAEPPKKEGAPLSAPLGPAWLSRQFSGTFLPSLYMYRVIAGFFSSPSGSNAMFAVTPL